MHTHYNGSTYTVVYDERDAALFSDHTDAPEATVVGNGFFVFDARDGDLVGRGGSATGREEIEWIAFSQDAQDFGVRDLEGRALRVNPYDHCLPELAAPNPESKRKRHRYIGRRVELVFTSDPYTNLKPGDRGTVKQVDDTGTVHVDWDRGSNLGLVPGEDQFQWITEENPARISRTRGVKTMKGPYSASKGYKPWIEKQGVLGEGFLTTMSKKERHASLDRCVADYGYRSCLGRIMVLERAKTGPRGKGEGVGVKYKKQLAESREYLKKTYGGKGSFKKDAKTKREAKEKIAAAADNPQSTKTKKKGKSGGKKRKQDAKRPDYHRRNLILDRELVLRALDYHGGQGSAVYSFGSTALSDYVSPSMIDAAVDELERTKEEVRGEGEKHKLTDLIGELDSIARFSSEYTTLEAGVGDVDSGYATWLMENPYQGDAVALAQYRQARQDWEQRGRRGPPPVHPDGHAAGAY